ncbi:MAG TPA: tRNA pseudouridine(55) synthase TruB [Acidobacteriaceae bacterium]|jgi:tRNA pseudouridine55 synthase|nr:tRNA pseudouridine(55) synthase TruB [Acidobacteriaceae bacterium]
MNGLLIVDKPGGMTSHDVVARVRRATGEQSVGHLGTLDPMATGVLPLLLGKFTRLAKFFNASEKAYAGTIRFGYATDTYDAEGQMVGEARPVALTLDAVRAEAALFLGASEQMPPPFSAKKINGKPAYKLAREGKTPELKPARIHVDAFTIESVDGDCAQFAMRISAGGYVRAVAHAMGQARGCGAHLASLRRTAAGPFTLEQALPLMEVERLAGATKLEERLVHPRKLLPEMTPVNADEQTVGRIRNGMQVNLPEYSDAAMVKIFAGQRELVAIGKRVAGTLFHPAVVVLTAPADPAAAE